jgi:hypothetical protein
MAQEPYYPAYGYSPEPGYDTDNTTRQLTFSPGDAMNRMGNPMRNIFGSPSRRYDDYPTGDYAPPAYPPAYGYPAYPGYQQPYTGYGYPAQTPVGPGYSGAYASPSGQPAQAGPAPRPVQQPPAYERVPPARQDYQPMFTNPEQATHYRFRPLQEPAPATVGEPQQVPAPKPSESAEPVVAAPPTPAYHEPEPLAPLTYPQDRIYAQPMAPLSYPEAPTPAPAATVEQRDSSIQQDHELNFRPLDKPGYSSDLGQ